MSYLSISGVTKSFGSNLVVQGFDLEVERGEFVSLLGPSGCGKTTMLRIVAGFESPSAGRVVMSGEDVTNLTPNKRRVGMVFQSYALFPNMSVFENVAFGLKIAGIPRPELERRVAELLEMVGLSALKDRYSYQLSGGQQQRVALARALAPRPRVLLLDEPLSALDAQIRVSLRTEMRQIQRELGITTLFVTHDQEEALSMSDRVVVMNGGRVEQVDVPHRIYQAPATRFVAGFVGALNLFEAKVINAAKGTVALSGVEIALGRKVPHKAGEAITLALRPEALRHGGLEDCDVVLPAILSDVEFLGSVLRLRASAGGATVMIDSFSTAGTAPPVPGSATTIGFRASDLLVLDPVPAQAG
jgi:putative spermidine/putrescine transport system ATP-binding protein